MPCAKGDPCTYEVRTRQADARDRHGGLVLLVDGADAQVRPVDPLGEAADLQLRCAIVSVFR